VVSGLAEPAPATTLPAALARRAGWVGGVAASGGL